MAEIRTNEGLVVGLIEPTTEKPEDKPKEGNKQQETAKNNQRRKQHDE